MRLEYFRCHNVGPFEDFDLDLRELGDARAVAIRGPNGAGKSFTLETAIAGAAYRQMPTHGKLAKRATARDSSIESHLVNGQRWVVRHMLDAVSGKTESVVLNEHGQPAFDGTGAKSFAAWSAKHMPDPSVLYATQFAVQKSEGFIDLSSAERISVILKAVGVERIERMAEGARKRVSKVKEQLAALAVRIDDARAGAPDVATVEAELADLLAAAVEADARLATARKCVADAEAECHRVEALRVEADQAQRIRDAAEADVVRAKLRLQDLEQRAAGHRDIVSQGDRIRAAVARVAELRDFVATEERTVQELEAQAEAAQARKEELDGVVAKSRATVADLQERIANNRMLLGQADEIRKAVEGLADIRAQIVTTEQQSAVVVSTIDRHAELSRLAGDALAKARLSAMGARLELDGADETERLAAGFETAIEIRHVSSEALKAIERAVSDLRGKQIAGADERIAGLRDGLIAIRDGAGQPAEIAGTTLRQDDGIERDARELPLKLGALEEEVRKQRVAVDTAQSALVTVERAQAALPGIRAARDQLTTAEASEAQSEAQKQAADKAVSEAKLQHRELFMQLGALHEREAALVPLAARAEPLAVASARIQAYEPQLAAARAELEQAQAALQAAPPVPAMPDPARIATARAELARLEPEAAKAEQLSMAQGSLVALEPELVLACDQIERTEILLAAAPVPEPLPDLPDLPALCSRVPPAESAAMAAHSHVARAEQTLVLAHAAAERVATLEDFRADIDVELSDWTRLALDLGRDGIQSAEVDSAGPELTETCNDLLRSCHGPRFTLSIETQRLKSDGKGEVDECRVQVIDTVKGADREAQEFSGGERVIIGEAVSLALTMLACRRSGVQRPTLVRDESGAALDVDNAPVYVRMVKRAVDQIGAHMALIVSHSPAVWELCDATIQIGDEQADQGEQAA